MTMPTADKQRRVLLTGATGYIGGRLLRLLEEGPYRLRCMARSPEGLAARVDPATEVVAGDVLDRESLDAALAGVDSAFYLIHSMGDSGDFVAKELEAARNFAEAAQSAGVRRIVYLGGLGGDDLSPHLESRQRVGDEFRRSGVQTIELRSSVVIGSGSVSFELVRALVDHLPVMITPSWVRKRTQPIAVEDVLAYLLGALELEVEDSRIVEIGSPDIVSYAELMSEYASQQGLKRLLIPVPVLTPRLSSLWLGLVTPVYARVGRKLISSLRNETIVRDPSARELFPEIEPKGVRVAIERAILREDLEYAETRWSDALSSKGSEKGSESSQGYGGVRYGKRLVDRRCLAIDLPPAEAFAPVQRIGGASGWYFANFLWGLRGFLDLLMGGVGIRRGRRHPVELRTGDALDWWRVEAIEPNRMLRLVAEMKVPGRAWLQFEVEPKGASGQHSLLYQTAIFDPKGLAGPLYWYGIYPVHALVFRGMIRGIAKQARRLSQHEPASSPAPMASLDTEAP